MRASYLLDYVGLGEPLRVGADFVLDHGGERVHFAGKPADHWDFRNDVHQGKKRSAPRFDEQHAAGFSQDALHFRKSLAEVGGEIGQVVQAALHDEHVFGAIGEGKLATIGDDAVRGAFVLGNQARRKVHAFKMSEAEALQRY